MLSKKVGPCSNQHVPMWQTPNNVTCTQLMTTTMIPFLLVSALLTVMASQEQGILGITGGSYWAGHIVEYDSHSVHNIFQIFNAATEGPSNGRKHRGRTGNKT